MPNLREEIKQLFGTSYYKFVAENDGKCCDICRHFDGMVFRNDDAMKPELPIHKNCRCFFVPATAAEIGKAWIPITISDNFDRTHFYSLDKITKKAKEIYEFSIPKPPRITEHKANWTHMTWMWFFEQGENPAHFSSDSPESRDIANSFSMKQLKKNYFRTGEIPKKWEFTGPGTATGEYGEVEWFLGSYAIHDFKVKDGIATFIVYNKSGWRSGTRLPKSWTEALKEKTTLQIEELVTDAPRGQVIKTKIEKNLPFVLNFPVTQRILKQLPSFGGDWEQYYEIQMEWEK